MKDLVKAFKLENLIYDVEKKSGTIFNFSDVLECGNLGICGILNMEDMPLGNDSFEMWKMIHDSLITIRSCSMYFINTDPIIMNMMLF